jgi:hypothetical protein
MIIGVKRLNNSKGKKKFWIPDSSRVLLCLLVFLIFIVLSLSVTDWRLKDFTGKKSSTYIFAFYEKDKGVYNIDFLGKRSEIDTQRIWHVIEGTMHLIESVFYEEKSI